MANDYFIAMIAPLRQFLDSCIDRGVFPGCALGVLHRGETNVVVSGRLTYDPDAAEVTAATVYDVASITKAIPTACLALQLMEQGVLSLHSRLADSVPGCTGRFLDRVTLLHLLTHTLDFDFRLSDKKELPPERIVSSITGADLKCPPGEVYCYANATSILLGLMIERVTGTSLDRLAQERFFAPLGMNATTFFPAAEERGRIAPSEIDPWRNREVRGEVHDESAAALRPLVVAGSAGLFSTVSDLLRFLAMLLNRGVWDGHRYFAPETVTLMHTNALTMLPDTQAALGWELAEERFMGAARTPSMFGKTGFTGCTVVVDPASETGFVLLTNHTWPRRRTDKDEINKVRRALTEAVFSR